MSEIDLDLLVDSVRNYVGLVRKLPIKAVVEKLSTTHRYGNALPNFGDDAAVIPFKDEYLLLAADGMMAGLILNEPYAAGKASVMVTVNDIYSMGGRPLGMVNVLASGDEQQRALIVDGIQKGCQKLRVPMLGGHLHPDPEIVTPALSVAILGVTRNPLRSHLARKGDNLILAVDLDGKPGCRSVVSWDANSGKTSQELIDRLEVMPKIAEQGLSHAAKDISNAGILGTIAIFLENSGKGGRIFLDAIPLPSTIELKDWLHCFQSFGFILAVAPEKSMAVLELFSNQNINAAIVGEVTGNDRVLVEHNQTSRILFDFMRDEITGIRYKGAGKKKSTNSPDLFQKKGNERL